MNINQKKWLLVAMVVFVTISTMIGTIPGNGQQAKNQDNKSWNPEKYPVVNYDAPEPSNALERDERKEKNKRYDKKGFVMPNPRPETVMSTIYDAEPEPQAIPLSESKLIVIGQIIDSNAQLSNDRSGVYSEYSVQVENVLKQSSAREVHKAQVISIDRAGGRIRYSNGATVVYMNSGQGFPDLNGRYLLFLDSDDSKNPNFKLITAYQFIDGKVYALDHPKKFHDFDGRNEDEFIALVTNSNNKDKAKPTPAQDKLDKYAVTDYDSPLPENLVEREKRQSKNQRYDNQEFVIKNPRPEDSAVERDTESIPPPLFPVEESNLIVVGSVTDMSAHLSNNKRGIYSEFTIQVDEIFKDDAGNKLNRKGILTADRPGGYVRYPNGQKVLYKFAKTELPEIGKTYLFFLTSDKRDPNYGVIRIYELTDGSVKPLDLGRRFDDFGSMNKTAFLNVVRSKLSGLKAPGK